MPVKTRTWPVLTGNQLKLIAMAAMTADHVGLLLLPQYPLLRVLGRLALPIYAYMIAEGWRYTHDRRAYAGRLLGLGLLCQAVYYFAMGSLYQCVLMTFSLSMGLMACLEWAARRGPGAKVLALGAAMGAAFVCHGLPALLPGTDFAVDYGFFGAALPVAVYFGRTPVERLLGLTLGLTLLAAQLGGSQWWALAAVPLLALYSGQRGRRSLGRLFYLFYPLHLAAIYGLSLIL